MSAKDEINKLMSNDYFSNSYTGFLQQTIIKLFYFTGIRRSELLALRIIDFDFSQSLIKVLGKGNKERLIPFGKRAKFCLDNYLKKRALAFKTSSKGTPLFVNSKNKRVPQRTIQRRIGNYIKLVAEGKDLYSWHHLISGNYKTIHETRNTVVTDGTKSETDVEKVDYEDYITCLLYTSPSPRD